MPTCAKVVTVDGVQYLALDVENQNLTACQYVVESGVEVSNTIWALSAADGAVFSGGLISCWLAAYGVRSIITILKGSTNE